MNTLSHTNMYTGALASSTLDSPPTKKHQYNVGDKVLWEGEEKIILKYIERYDQDGASPYIIEQEEGWKANDSIDNERDLDRSKRYLAVSANKLKPLVTKFCETCEKSESEEEQFKVGDWVVITESQHNWNSGTNGMDKFIGKVVQIRTIYSNDRITFENDERWTWTKKDDHFRKALPSEIPTNSDLTVTVTGAALNDPVILGVPVLRTSTSIQPPNVFLPNESPLDYAKRMYPPGTKFIARDNGEEYTVWSNPRYAFTNNGGILVLVDIGNFQYIYTNTEFLSKGWAEIVSRPESQLTESTFNDVKDLTKTMDKSWYEQQENALQASIDKYWFKPYKRDDSLPFPLTTEDYIQQPLIIKRKKSKPSLVIIV